MITQRLVGGKWTDVGRPFCAGGRPPLDLGAVSAAASRGLPSPSILRAPPASGIALVHVDVIYWLGVGDGFESLPAATLVGYHVEFRVQVTSARWDFGDGHSAVSRGGGRPYDLQLNPCRTKQCPGYFTHAYDTKGQRTVTATASWTAQYRVDGGGWTDLGTITGRQIAMPIHIFAARTILVQPGH